MAAAESDQALVVPPLDDDQLQGVYTWLDSVPLSRPKRNCTRDFSDGVMLAEVIGHYFPKLVQMHNYSAANSIKQKMYNWSTLSQKVLRRMKFDMSDKEIEAIVNCVPNVVEHVLMRLQARISEIKAQRAGKSGMRTSASSSTMRSSAGRVGSMPGAAMSAVGAEPMSAASSSGAFAPHAPHGGDARSETAMLVQKEQRIQELEETNEYLELKIKKLEQLVRLKDNRIATLQARVASGREGLA